MESFRFIRLSSTKIEKLTYQFYILWSFSETYSSQYPTLNKSATEYKNFERIFYGNQKYISYDYIV